MSVADQEIVSSLGWLIRMRWLAGASVIVAAVLFGPVLGIGLPAAKVTFVGLGIFAYNAVFRYVLGRADRLDAYGPAAWQWFARVQIALDWMAMADLISLSGGIESPAIIFFLFHITIASLLLPHDRGFLYVTLAPILVAAIAALEAAGVLQHVSLVEPPRYRNPVYVGEVLVFFTSASYVMAYLAMSISRRLRRRETEITELYESIRTSTSTLDLTVVLERLAEGTRRVLGCQGAAIRLLDPTGSQLVKAASAGLSDAYMDKGPLELARSPIDREALGGRAVLTIDVTSDERLAYPKELAAEGICTMLIAPVPGRNGPIGVLRAYGGEAHVFTRDDQAFLAAVAAHGAIAIENAQAYEMVTSLDRQQSTFLRTVTHELRSPVQVVQNLLALLEQGYVGSLTAEQSDLVSRARRRIEFLQTLVDDLLELAAGKADTRPRAGRGAVHLSSLVRDVCNRFVSAAMLKNVELRVETDEEGLCVFGEAKELDHVLTNLLSNAVRYTPVGGITVRLERDGDYAQMVVRDTGIGIPKDALPHVFEEFYRAPNARAVEERGTGLGLAIVRTLVERYLGTLSVESEEGRGTTFTVRLPLAAESAIACPS